MASSAHIPSDKDPRDASRSELWTHLPQWPRREEINAHTILYLLSFEMYVAVASTPNRVAFDNIEDARTDIISVVQEVAKSL